MCWNPSNFSRIFLPFLEILPGPCFNSSLCSCGVYPQSDKLCSGSICKSCPIQFPASPPNQFPPSSNPTPSSSSPPTITRGGSNSRSNNSPPSRSLTIRRQGSRMLSMRRQRSGTSSMKHPDKAEEFSFSELASATGNFPLENKIGSGSFRVVYRGKLNDGREVAIKPCLTQKSCFYRGFTTSIWCFLMILVDKHH